MTSKELLELLKVYLETGKKTLKNRSTMLEKGIFEGEEKDQMDAHVKNTLDSMIKEYEMFITEIQKVS